MRVVQDWTVPYLVTSVPPWLGQKQRAAKDLGGDRKGRERARARAGAPDAGPGRTGQDRTGMNDSQASCDPLSFSAVEARLHPPPVVAVMLVSLVGPGGEVSCATLEAREGETA